MKKAIITLAHGAGGKLSHELVRRLFLPYFDNDLLRQMDDSAVFSSEKAGRLAFTTDSHVVKPLFFPGGDIGRLAVCGTVNDLAMAGARPLCLSAAFIIEEGFPEETLEKILTSMQEAAREARVKIVTGDTKVVEKGAAEGLFITTAGVGIVPEGVEIQSRKAQPGDRIILSGFIGEHEVAVLIARGEFSIKGEVKSDCAPLNGLVEMMLETAPGIHSLRDPTRGGMATVLWEIANASGVGMVAREEVIPVGSEVRGVCELLGFDPYYLANEGKLIAVCPEGVADQLVLRMRSHPLGKDSVIIGQVVKENPGRVLLQTRIGGHRILEPLSGEQFPRIC
ncbi:MAG: hydrogenase expression/formation protein HypE [Proteobacteria bacterium]|nr:hydrogenase expression/formation protein HypE [Pseudomonadota bacterium]